MIMGPPDSILIKVVHSKRMLYRVMIVSLFSIVWINPLSAQYSIRGSIFHFERVTNRLNWNGIIAADHDLTERSTLGLDITIGPDLLNQIMSSSLGDDGIMSVGEYELERSSFGFSFRSQYFFMDNNDGIALYLGPFLGIRYTSFKLSQGIQNSGVFGSSISVKDSSFSTFTYPVGLRIGIRNGLSGAVGDLYLGIGYQFGSKSVPELDNLKSRDQLAKLFIQIGYTVGAGWN